MTFRQRRPAAVLLRARIAERLGARGRAANSSLAELRARLARTEERIGALVSFVANGDHSDYVRSALRDFESQASDPAAQIAELEREAQQPIHLPRVEELVERALDLERVVADEPLLAREALRRYFDGGRITLEPGTDGVYTARARFFPLVSLAASSTRIPDPRRPSEPQRTSPPVTSPGACSRPSRAGAQLDFPTQQIQSVAEVWVPFEESIAIGW